MLSYITIGANNLQHSGHFYTAILVPLGYEMTETAHGIEFTAPPLLPGRVTTQAAIYVKHPFDGQPATPSNGAMNAFQAETQAMV